MIGFVDWKHINKILIENSFIAEGDTIIFVDVTLHDAEDYRNLFNNYMKDFKFIKNENVQTSWHRIHESDGSMTISDFLSSMKSLIDVKKSIKGNAVIQIGNQYIFNAGINIYKEYDDKFYIKYEFSKMLYENKESAVN